jgi:hypothetical protein
MCFLHTNDIKIQFHPHPNQQLHLAFLEHPTYIMGRNTQQACAGLLLLLLVTPLPLLLTWHYG